MGDKDGELSSWLAANQLEECFHPMKSNGYYLNVLKMLDDTAFDEMCSYCGFLRGTQVALKIARTRLSSNNAPKPQDLPPAYADPVPPMGSARQAAQPVVSAPAVVVQPTAQVNKAKPTVEEQLRSVEKKIISVDICLDTQASVDFLDRRLDQPSDNLSAAERELKTIDAKAGHEGKKKGQLLSQIETLRQRLLQLKFGDDSTSTFTTSVSFSATSHHHSSPSFSSTTHLNQNNNNNNNNFQNNNNSNNNNNNNNSSSNNNNSNNNNNNHQHDKKHPSGYVSPDGLRVGDLVWKQHTHSLTLKNQPYGPGNMATCKVCNQRTAICFHCAIDRYDVCVECAVFKNPDPVKHAWLSANHEHPLGLVSNPYSRDWRCRLCPYSDSHKPVYHCAQCRYDACIYCAIGIPSPQPPVVPSTPPPSTPSPVLRPYVAPSPAPVLQRESEVESNSNSSSSSSSSFDVSLLARLLSSPSRDLQVMWELLLALHSSMNDSSIGEISLNAGNAQQSMRNMYVALLKYEDCINASAQHPDWLRFKRAQWRKRIERTDDWSLAHFATCILAAECHILNEAQHPLWRIKREGWKSKCAQAGASIMQFDMSAQRTNVSDAEALLVLLRLLS